MISAALTAAPLSSQALVAAGWPSIPRSSPSAKAWPFEEARKLVAAGSRRRGRRRCCSRPATARRACRISGTFGEVARTTMVRHAFRVLTGDSIKTRLLAFSDDMDGLRKVPDNVCRTRICSPRISTCRLTKVPDPFGTHASFGAHNNARLRAFLDEFGFDYEFASSTDYYTSGRFSTRRCCTCCGPTTR